MLSSNETLATSEVPFSINNSALKLKFTIGRLRRCVLPLHLKVFGCCIILNFKALTILCWLDASKGMSLAA